MLYAFSEATVPKITLITRKAYGGAYIAMCCRELGADQVIAWPSAEIAVMGAEGAAGIIFRKEIDAAENPEEKRNELITDYRERFSNPYAAAQRGYVDMVIEPKETRRVLDRILTSISNKKVSLVAKKHGNIPL